VPPGSWYGTLLTGIFNFTPEPSWAQVVVWVAYVAVTTSLYLVMLRRRQPAGRVASSGERVESRTPALGTALRA
jgi:high-affinity iron transporter